jgi:hypothetical protein
MLRTPHAACVARRLVSLQRVQCIYVSLMRPQCVKCTCDMRHAHMALELHGPLAA